MRHLSLSKSLLALAITTASAASLAANGPVDHNISSGPYVLSSGIINGDVTITGEANLTDDAVTIESTQLNDITTITGDLVLDATISVDTTGSQTPNQASAVEVSGVSFGDVNTDPQFVQIDGQIINKGRLTAKGLNAQGLTIEYASIEEGIRNEGVINISDAENAPNTEAGPAGISIRNANIDGEVTNAGSITVVAGDADVAGIQILDSDLDEAAFLNSGTITASAEEAFGIDISGGEIGSITNTGSVTANGTERSIGLYLDYIEVEDGVVTNSGSIIATGADATGIKLDDAELTSIINSGTIKGDTYGINFDDDDNMVVEITQSAGLIEGGQFAINGGTGNTVNVALSGGTIRGNIGGVTGVTVNGPVTFDGASINSNVQLLSNASASAYLSLIKPQVSFGQSLSLDGGATLELPLSSQTNAASPILSVADSATFGAASKIVLSATGSDFKAEGAQYSLVKAASITNNGLEVASKSALLNIDSFNVGSDEITAIVTGKGVAEADNVLSNSGASANAQNAFNPFYASVLSQLGSNDPLAQAFANADAAELARLSEQLSPPVNGASSQGAALTQNMVNSAIGNALGGGASPSGSSSGSHLDETGLWLQALGNKADQGHRGRIEGYDADTKGVTIGIDGKPLEDLTLGVAYSYLDTHVKTSSHNKTQIDTQVLTLYSGVKYGDLFVNADLNYGFNDNTSKRYIAGTQAKADYDSKMLGFNLTAGYGFHFDNLVLEPRVAARYNRLDIDSYSEKGSSASLKVSKQRYEVIELGVGARLAAVFEAGPGQIEPEVRLMAYHDFAADTAKSTSAYVLGSAPFVTNGAKAVRTSYEAGLGLNYHLGALSLGASYEHVSESRYNANMLQARVRYDF